MIQLVDVTEENWLEITRLGVREDQQAFLDRPLGIIALPKKEGKYSCVEVCVNKADAPALRMYEKAGFADTGYIDEDAPDCLNLMCCFE